MIKRNYKLELEQLLDSLQGDKKSLLLHSCCAPCSSYTLEYLSSHFDITVFYYNPNITDKEEYRKRVEEQIRFINQYPFYNQVSYLEGNYNPDDFYTVAKGKETQSEGGSRCFACYELRLQETAKIAKEKGFDYFTTTLSISPHKNADKLNVIGERVGEEYGVPFLPSDFKKKNGYKRSIELSKEYNLYRQEYCGCEFSKRAALDKPGEE